MNTWQERISRTGFLTSSISYVVFWLCNALRPGFVARYLSVHVFLLFAVLFGAWWALSVREYRDRPLVQYAVALLFGIVFASITWNVGAAFEAYRVIAVAVALLLPIIVVSLIRST